MGGAGGSWQPLTASLVLVQPVSLQLLFVVLQVVEVNRGQRVARNGHFNIRLGMKDEDGSKTAGGRGGGGGGGS